MLSFVKLRYLKLFYWFPIVGLLVHVWYWSYVQYVWRPTTLVYKGCTFCCCSKTIRLISILLQVVINFQTESHYYFTMHSSYEVDKGEDISVDQRRLVRIGIGYCLCNQKPISLISPLHPHSICITVAYSLMKKPLAPEFTLSSNTLSPSNFTAFYFSRSRQRGFVLPYVILTFCTF